MGRPKGKNQKAKKRAKKKVPVKETPESKYTLEQLLDKAQELVDQYEYSLAQKFVQRALETNSDDVRALELAATLFIEAGDSENARHYLGRAITVAPEEGYTKYLALAQLFSGREALQLYKKGIEIMKNKTDKEGADISREMSNAFCACAELFMTDLCDEQEAEEEVKGTIEKALEADNINPEAWQTKARYLLIRENFQECKEVLSHSLTLWLPKYMAILDNKQETAGSVDPVEVCPLHYGTRIALVRMLIEMEMWEEATKVLEGLLEEDDEVVETWYLLGWLNHLRASQEGQEEEGYNGNARFYLSKAKRVNGVNPTNDVELLDHIDELLTEIGPDDQTEEDEEQDDWSAVDSTDEEDSTEQNSKLGETEGECHMDKADKEECMDQN